MDIMSKSLLRSKAKASPKAKPLAEKFVAETIRQGATLGDFKSAIDIALIILKHEMDPDSLFLDGFASEIEAAFKSI